MGKLNNIIIFMFSLMLCSCITIKGGPGNFYKIKSAIEKDCWAYTHFGHCSIIEGKNNILMTVAWTGEKGIEKSISIAWYGESSVAIFDTYEYNGYYPECNWSIESKGLGPVNQYIEDGCVSYFDRSKKDDYLYVELLNEFIIVFDKMFIQNFGISIR